MKTRAWAIATAMFVGVAGVTLAQAAPAGSAAPKIRGETVNGKSIELPDAAAGKVTLLILGFSKKAGQETGAWREHVLKDFAGDARFATYSVAVLEDAPAFVRPMIRSGIRSGTPEALRDHMVTTASGEAEWMKVLGASDKDVPYLVLLDPAGHFEWSGSGVFKEQEYAQLKGEVKRVENR